MVRLSLLLLLFACGSGAAAGKPGVQRGACSSWQEDGPADLKWARAVLEDSLQRTYCASLEERRSAFDHLRYEGAGDLLPLVLRVAAMDYSPDRGEQQTLDVISIRESLILLTELKNPQAAELNLARLEGDSWLQSAAVTNLTQLEHWEATPEIQRLVDRTDLDQESLLLAGLGLSFLSKSPRTTNAVCSSVERARSAFPQCFEEAPGLRCRELISALPALESRFDCR